MTDKPDVTIRRIRIDDLDAVQELYAAQVASETDPLSAIRVTAKQHAWEMRRLRQQWMVDQRYLSYVATIETKAEDGSTTESVVGYIAAVIQNQARLYEVEALADIGELWVLPEHRGRGIGTTLAEYLFEDINNHGIDWITVHLVGNPDGVAEFFQKIGFKTCAVEMRCRLSELENKE